MTEALSPVFTNKTIDMSDHPRKALLDLYYFPCIAYFSALLKCEEVILEACGSFEKQTYRNRCYINAANGVGMLSVPIQKPKAKPALYKSVRQEAGNRWANNHWRAIQSAYGQAPFFEYYADDIKSIIDKRPPLLYDMNREILSLCLELLGISVKVSETLGYVRYTENDVLDLRGAFLPSKRSEAGTYPSYYQVFGNVFEKNLSILDLLFCEGPGAAAYLKALS